MLCSFSFALHIHSCNSICNNIKKFFVNLPHHWYPFSAHHCGECWNSTAYRNSHCSRWTSSPCSGHTSGADGNTGDAVRCATSHYPCSNPNLHSRWTDCTADHPLSSADPCNPQCDAGQWTNTAGHAPAGTGKATYLNIQNATHVISVIIEFYFWQRLIELYFNFPINLTRSIDIITLWLEVTVKIRVRSGIHDIKYQ